MEGDKEDKCHASKMHVISPPWDTGLECVI